MITISIAYSSFLPSFVTKQTNKQNIATTSPIPFAWVSENRLQLHVNTHMGLTTKKTFCNIGFYYSFTPSDSALPKERKSAKKWYLRKRTTQITSLREVSSPERYSGLKSRNSSPLSWFLCYFLDKVPIRKIVYCFFLHYKQSGYSPLNCCDLLCPHHYPGLESHSVHWVDLLLDRPCFKSGSSAMLVPTGCFVPASWLSSI